MVLLRDFFLPMKKSVWKNYLQYSLSYDLFSVLWLSLRKSVDQLLWMHNISSLFLIVSRRLLWYLLMLLSSVHNNLVVYFFQRKTPFVCLNGFLKKIYSSIVPFDVVFFLCLIHCYLPKISCNFWGKTYTYICGNTYFFYGGCSSVG